MLTTLLLKQQATTKRFLPPLQRHLSSISDRRRRSVHFVPADNDKFLSKALTLGADTIVLDLEDSVKDKQVGREKLRAFLDVANSLPGRSTTEVLVRINPLSSSVDDWREDIAAGFDGSDGFMVPKVETQDELKLLDETLSGMETSNNSSKVLLPIATETPLAVMHIADIAKGPRVCAITWGCEDLSAVLGSYSTRDNNSGAYLDVFRHCQTMCLLAAKAAGVQAIDGVYQNVRDMDGFQNEANYAKSIGFDGKLTLHPGQISALHKVLEPTRKEREEAAMIVTMWERSIQKGAIEIDGKMIDLPHYVRAKKVLARVGADKDASGEQGTAVSTGSNEGSNTSIDSKKEGHDDDDEVFPRVCMGKFFEDLEPGLKIRHFLTRTVTEADNVFFTCLTLNPAPIHLDHELFKGNASSLSGKGGNSNSGKPLFNSMFTLALLVGMSVPEATHGTTVANLGFSEVLFPKPVYPGDTLRAETIILERRESKSRPTQGIVTLQHVAYNQRGDVVCKATRQALMKKK
mmetsp:Transcript_20796/g.34284  ORF Transcript_20796/g.34284 Transcript_20796/m.34284 type:complete len:519 (-) Transcript_20796:17-1573(-)